ncbi:MAG: hypothetical protein CM1200mP3_14640 [Chloroflexota bacterium]|nr:MAG: hypothetical protein CM1200mP3_14640 [Chloroflexota bacterium]
MKNESRSISAGKPQEVDEELRSEKRDSLSDHVLAQMFAWPELFELLSDVDTDVFEKTEDKKNIC